MIRLEGVCKRYGRLDVLKGIDLEFEAGTVTAVAGPNGSGKSTLLRIVLGLVRPDHGRVYFDGRPLNGDWRYRERVGYMPQAPAFPENLTGAEVLALLKDLRGNPAGTDEELLDAFALAPELDKPVRTLSTGTRQKVSAAAAFLFRPDVLVLDEPTAGLDPSASAALKDKILREKAAGRTFLLSSHIMSELEELSDRVVFLLDGAVRYAGPALGLAAETGQVNLERAAAQLMRREAS
ncbi:MAG TPA: ABC transporter ATP-binding protein [Longimicrobiales bacterium]